jgi:hypothetical protein
MPVATPKEGRLIPTGGHGRTGRTCGPGVSGGPGGVSFGALAVISQPMTGAVSLMSVLANVQVSGARLACDVGGPDD